MLVARAQALPSALEVALVAIARGTAIRPATFEDTLKLCGGNKAAEIVLKRGFGGVQRADQTVSTTATLPQIATSVMGEFFASLAPMSAAAMLRARGLQTPVPAGHAGLSIPGRVGTPPATVPFVKEGSPISVRKFALNTAATLTPKKFGFIVVITRELAKRGGGEEIIRLLVREDAAAAIDAAYFSNLAATDTVHDGLLNGLTPIAGFSGADKEAARTDLVALTNAVSVGGSGQILFVVSPSRYARLPLIWPDLDINNFMPSLAVAEDAIVAVDPLSIAHAFGDDFDIDASDEAVLHMEDSNPLEIVSGTGPTTSDPVRSVYQTDCIAVRLLGDVAFAKRRSGAVAVVNGASW